MNFNTHQAAGLVAAGIILSLTKTEIGSTWLLGALAGSLGAALPDIDHAQSTPAKAIPIAGYVTGKTLKHRGPLTHSIWSLLLLGGIFYFYKDALMMFPTVIFLCFLAAMYSHHLLDKFTSQGLKWLWPLQINFWPIPQALRINTGSQMERILIRPSLWLMAAYVWLSPLIS